MKERYPLIALGLGLLLSLILLRFSPLNGDAAAVLPLLTSLLMAELGFLVTGIAAVVGIRRVTARGLELAVLALIAGNLLLAGNFLWLGLALWGQTGSM